MASAHGAPSAAGAGKRTLTLAAVMADAHVSARNLRPGTYVISMTAVNAHGVRSNRAVVKFWVVKRVVKRASQRRSRSRAR
jgi:predicted phage tail protein